MKARASKACSSVSTDEYSRMEFFLRSANANDSRNPRPDELENRSQHDDQLLKPHALLQGDNHLG